MGQLMIKNVLSLFDGISCGQIALNRIGVKYDNYYASEVDKHAITVTDANYPKTIQLGDVTKVKASDLPDIYLLMGGSPCQGFSFAGKQLNFDDPRSALFFEFVRLVEECKPKYFFLENVPMKQDYQDVISQILGVQPIEINSSKLSAQSRKRLYWTNIPQGYLPVDKGLQIKDIVDAAVVDIAGTYTKSTKIKRTRSEGCLEVGHADNINGHDFLKRIYSIYGKSPTLTAISGGNQERKIAITDTTWRKLTPVECERLQTVPDGYTDHISKQKRYRALGNGWTVDVICHLFKGLLP
jgi:DNA-cytosine methyltransferase